VASVSYLRGEKVAVGFLERALEGGRAEGKKNPPPARRRRRDDFCRKSVEQEERNEKQTPSLKKVVREIKSPCLLGVWSPAGGIALGNIATRGTSAKNGREGPPEKKG